MTMDNHKTKKNLKHLKQAGEKIACLTAYDAAFAKIEDEAGVDMILVGDSLGMVLHGKNSTKSVTMDEMVYHTTIVRNGIKKGSLLVSDMPYNSYSEPKKALQNAMNLINEGGADMVKLEGGGQTCEIVSTIKKNGIPVCGHLGLTPQYVNIEDGFKVQATTIEAAKKLEEDALKIQQAGADCLVLECIPSQVAKNVSDMLSIPTIGIGAGIDCDGQVLVVYDMLGITGKKFKFLKNFLDSYGSINKAIEGYVAEVKNKLFPSSKYSYK